MDGLGGFREWTAGFCNSIAVTSAHNLNTTVSYPQNSSGVSVGSIGWMGNYGGGSYVPPPDYTFPAFTTDSTTQPLLPSKKRTAVDWLRERVEEMCSLGDLELAMV